MHVFLIYTLTVRTQYMYCGPYTKRRKSSNSGNEKHHGLVHHNHLSRDVTFSSQLIFYIELPRIRLTTGCLKKYYHTPSAQPDFYFQIVAHPARNLLCTLVAVTCIRYVMQKLRAHQYDGMGQCPPPKT